MKKYWDVCDWLFVVDGNKVIASDAGPSRNICNIFSEGRARELFDAGKDIKIYNYSEPIYEEPLDTQPKWDELDYDIRHDDFSKLLLVGWFDFEKKALVVSFDGCSKDVYYNFNDEDEDEE